MNDGDVVGHEGERNEQLRQQRRVQYGSSESVDHGVPFSRTDSAASR